MMRKLLIATNNSDKVKEIKSIFNGLYDDVISLKDAGIDLETVEDGDTFEANAYKKAREGFNASGMDTLADDSGLCVDALDGAPGVYSARFAGESATYLDNNKKLAALMADVPDERRTAKFVCAVCLITAGGKVITARGEFFGRISREPSGENGFGYDPYFYIPKYCCTLAQMPAEMKNEISHRAAALHALKKKIAEEKHQ